ncbi:ABC transporter permease [Ignatzschineria cameli]|uniref:Iron ABC transporter permease n=1 Tax=Ignatzschineria cameli TaxID=2182793 RepID=A0A2U2AU18_9GAMM|nr:ABC transporter permease [Ignatzschineria cameli]PWD87310.1 iron ABC transporter permease [Ignatzschineria cameli]PWD88202.1 iron ABC transporter permease [Ignatzschineria cameli]PWD91231.1 iron ABC transporter permease [Ignatzschineria cameli]PWD92872.1 iron ABC transporter permease [Ignatzschineria cameli]PWD93893.1 iron ABC transporter permease [Ignatzschineria cameli]
MRIQYWVLILIVLSAISLFVGVINISVNDLFNLTDAQKQTILISRIPRLITILIAGASLSISGLIMQKLSQNAFVSPTTAGTMESARLGILVAILLFAGASPLVKMGLAFLFALLGTFLFMKILNRIRYKDVVFVPLVGLMFGGIIGSISTFIAYKHDLIQNLASWLLGDFSMVMSGRYELIYISIPLMIIAYLYAHQFSIAGLGEDFSKNLGLKYQQVVNIGLAIVAMTTASVILTVGMIPFLGLIVPNIISLYKGDNIRATLPYTALLGAIIVLACDILGRIVIYPYEIPISVTIGILGSLLFIWLLFKKVGQA